MASVLNINFKCFMPIFGNEMVSSLPGNVKYIIHKLGNTILSSVYKTNTEGKFEEGYLVNNTDCNWGNIAESFSKNPDNFAVLHKQCITKSGLDTPINNIFTDAENNPHILLQQAITPHQNGTASIFDQLYKATNDYMFSQGNITETNGADFLGLNECTKEETMEVLQNYNAYKETLIPRASFINTLANTLNRLGISLDNVSPTEIGKHILDQLGKAYTEATTASPVNTLRNTLDRLGVSLDNISPTEMGKNILNLLDKPFTEATVSTTEKPNDDTNDSGSGWGYITVTALGGLVALGIVGKCAWDLYKKNKELLQLKHKNVELELMNLKLENMKIICTVLSEDNAILDVISGIGNLDDIITLANADLLESEGYLVATPTFIEKIQKLNTELTKLNSVPQLLTNLYSLGNILHNICVLLNSNDNYMAVQSFADLIKTTRSTDSKSNEYKGALEKIFNIFKVDETSSGEYHYIVEEELPNTVPLLADGSSPSESSGISVE